MRIGNSRSAWRDEVSRIYVITPYPPQVSGNQKISGLGTYIQNVLEQPPFKGRLIYLANRYSENNEEWLTPFNNRVKPIMDVSNDRLAIFKVLKHIKKGSKVVFNHDFAAYGGTVSALVMPIFLILLKLKSSELIVFQHSVLPNLNEMSGHLGKRDKSIRLAIFSIGIVLNLIMISNISKQVIVLDQILKDRFIKLPFVNRKKINVVNHPIYKYIPPDKDLDYLDEDKFNIVSFGFVAWYKGPDLLVEATEHENWPTIVKVILAGGKKIGPDDGGYYEKLLERVKENPFVVVTDFLPSEDIPSLFSEADLIILPYRTLMAASGPFAYALTYGKPFLLSDRLESYARSEDFAYLTKLLDIRVEDFTFNLDRTDDLLIKLRGMIQNKDLMSKLALLSRKLAGARELNSIQKQIADIIDNKK